MKLWKRRPAPLTVTLGGEAFEVQPLNLEEVCELVVMLLPYVASITIRFKSIAAAYKSERKELLQTLLAELASELVTMPGAMTKIMALLLHVEPEWLVQVATPMEIVQAISVLDEINDFATLIQGVADLGIDLEIIHAASR